VLAEHKLAEKPVSYRLKASLYYFQLCTDRPWTINGWTAVYQKNGQTLPAQPSQSLRFHFFNSC